MRRLQNSRGFTLIEMMVVIVIIVALAGLLLPVLSSARTKAAVAAARMDIGNLNTALAQFKADWGIYPPDEYYDSTMATATSVKAHVNSPSAPGELPLLRLGGVKIPTAQTDTGESGLFETGSSPGKTGNRALVFFLASRFDVSRQTHANLTQAQSSLKSYGPYFEPRQEQLELVVKANDDPLGYRPVRPDPTGWLVITGLGKRGNTESKIVYTYTGNPVNDVNPYKSDGSTAMGGSEGLALYEYLDPFGNPYVYHNYEDDRVKVDQLASGNGWTAPNDRDGLAPHKRYTYDLFSMGPDGETAGNDGENNDSAYDSDVDSNDADEVFSTYFTDGTKNEWAKGYLNGCAVDGRQHPPVNVSGGSADDVNNWH